MIEEYGKNEAFQDKDDDRGFFLLICSWMLFDLNCRVDDVKRIQEKKLEFGYCKDILSKPENIEPKKINTNNSINLNLDNNQEATLIENKTESKNDVTEIKN
ncbi:MAG: hypothetical protein PHZ07_02630 [Patescibacteria group bacterium]|nr:hypothetical protein [Patescibacteria group bacterium]MDD4304684.1 hypothetical protein [Patescibacteria group bacterium]MDD4695348.1 hypothetical protein [Patescibacteria group bacterium]